jgi:AbrB family looped-hinge helix DNA binding protein
MSKAEVKVSPKFQIVIPKEIREELSIRPGETLLLYTIDGGIRISPHRSVKDLRGIAKGISWEHNDRDHTERF